MPPPLAIGAIAVTILAWALAFPLIRLGLVALPPLPLAAVRFVIAAIPALAWLAWHRPPLPSRLDTVRLALCGLAGIALYNGFLNSGEMTVGAGAASFIINTVPMITALLALLFLGEGLNAAGWLGSAVSFGGIGLIAASQRGGLSFGAGTSQILAAATCQAAYFLLQRPLVPRYGALTCTAYTLLAGTILLAPWLPEAARHLAATPPDPTSLAAIVALGLVPAALGYAAWTVALGHFGAVRSANFLFLVSPVANALAFLLTGETPSPLTVAGGALAICGVIIVTSRGRTG